MPQLPDRVTNTSPTATLYTELPYPADGVMRTTNLRIVRAGLERHAPQLLARQKLRIVDVGCGTGENTAAFARFFPHAEIVGVDINPASLDLASKLADRLGTPVKFVQADIASNLVEKLSAASPGQFDIVCSIGVLHHLANPRVGFSAVRQLISPAGLFYCFVYAHYGRREEMAVKSLLNEMLPGDSWKARADAIGQLGLENINTVWTSVRRLGRRLKFGPPLRPLEILRAVLNRNRLVHESDTYSNPCEHLYRFADLKALLAETNWEFVALARHAGLPTTPEQHTRRPKTLALLRQLPEAALYDYFAFYYDASGFNFFCRPSNRA